MHGTWNHSNWQLTTAQKQQRSMTLAILPWTHKNQLLCCSNKLKLPRSPRFVQILDMTYDLHHLIMYELNNIKIQVSFCVSFMTSISNRTPITWINPLLKKFWATPWTEWGYYQFSSGDSYTNVETYDDSISTFNAAANLAAQFAQGNATIFRN